MVTETERIAILLQLENDNFERKAKRSERAVLAIERRFDPLARAAQRYEREQKSVNKALAAGKIDADRAKRALDNLEAEYRQATGAADQLATATRRMGTVTRGGAGGLQNVGYQVQDFAVQVGMGTSATMALGQQLPQLLSGFGLLGVLLGTTAAVAVPVARALFNMGEGAVTAEDAIEALGGSLDEYQSFVLLSSASTAELTERFGEFASQLRSFAQYMQGVSLALSLEALEDTIEPLKEGFADVLDILQRSAEANEYLNRTIAQRDQGFATDEQVLQATENLYNLRDAASAAAADIGILPTQVVALSAALDTLGEASGPEEVRDRAAEALAMIQQWYPAGQQLPAALRDVVSNLNSIVTQTAEVTTELESSAIAAEQVVSATAAMSGGLASASTVAAGLAGNLWNAAQAAFQVVAGMNAQTVAREGLVTDNLAAQYSQYGAGRQSFDRAASEARYSVSSQFPGFTAPAPSRGGGGGGGGGSSSNPLADAREAYDRLLQSLDPAVRALAKFEDAQSTVNAALEAGVITQAEAASTIALAAEEYDEATKAVDGLTEATEAGADAFTDLFLSIGDGADAAIDALKGLLLQMAKVQLQQGVLGLASNSSGVGSALGLLGGLLTPIGANANGTDNWQGGLTSVNERGGEILNLPTGTQVIPHDVSMEMARNSGGANDVHVVGGNLTLSDGGQIVANILVGTKSMIGENNRQILQTQRRA